MDDVACELPRALLCKVTAEDDELSGFQSCVQDESRRFADDGKRSTEEDLRCLGRFGGWRE